jgi:hypothetical protein
MYPELLERVTLFRVLHAVDQELADERRRERCASCGGPLHLAAYERKPRGGPDDIPDEYCRRLSLCCGRLGCRRRSLPPSCLFLGRRVYWAGVVLIVVALRQRRPDSYSVARIQKVFGVTRPTLLRWMSFFASAFRTSPTWQVCRGRVPCGVDAAELPASLLEHFAACRGDPQEGLVACLRFLAVG